MVLDLACSASFRMLRCYRTAVCGAAQCLLETLGDTKVGKLDFGLHDIKVSLAENG